jgi:hypothetical protein
MTNIICVLYDDPDGGYPPSYARGSVPKIEQYHGGQPTPSPEGIDFTPGELLGCVSGELGLREFVGLILGAEVPPAVVSALAEELGLLSSETRTLLEGAAVAGDPFELELAAAAAAVDEQVAANSLDELLRLELVRPTEVPRRFRFRHPLVRRAVHESAPTWGGRSPLVYR